MGAIVVIGVVAGGVVVVVVVAEEEEEDDEGEEEGQGRKKKIAMTQRTEASRKTNMSRASRFWASLRTTYRDCTW